MSYSPDGGMKRGIFSKFAGNYFFGNQLIEFMFWEASM